MQKYFIRLALSVSLIGLCLFSYVIPAYAATSVVLYLNPATASLGTGAAFSVQIRLSKNDGTFVNFVRANLNFPADKLSVSSISKQGSYFNKNDNDDYVTYNNTTGKIDIAAESSSTAKNGDFLVATVNFNTKNAGNAPVSFTAQSVAAFPPNGDSRLTGMSGGTYTINAPAPTPSPSPTPTPSPAVPSKPPSTSQPKPNPTPNPVPTPSPAPSPENPTDFPSEIVPTTTDPSGEFSIRDVKVVDITSRSATISWSISQPASVVIRYGSQVDNLSETIQIDNGQTTSRVTLKDLPPGKTIYFAVTANDGSNQTQAKGSFKTLSAGGLLKRIMLLVLGAAGLMYLVLFLLRKKKTKRAKTIKKTPLPFPVAATPSRPPSLVKHPPIKQPDSSPSPPPAPNPNPVPQPVARAIPPAAKSTSQTVPVKTPVQTQPAPPPKTPTAVAVKPSTPTVNPVPPPMPAPAKVIPPKPSTNPKPVSETKSKEATVTVTLSHDHDPKPPPSSAKLPPEKPPLLAATKAKSAPAKLPPRALRAWPWSSASGTSPTKPLPKDDYANEPDIFETGEKRLKEEGLLPPHGKHPTKAA